MVIWYVLLKYYIEHEYLRIQCFIFITQMMLVTTLDYQVPYHTPLEHDNYFSSSKEYRSNNLREK